MVNLEFKIGEVDMGQIPFGAEDFDESLSYLKELNDTVTHMAKVPEALGLERNIGKDLDLVSIPDEALMVMQLRSQVFQKVDYFKDSIAEVVSGYNFDKYDKQDTVNIMLTDKAELIGTVRVVLDSLYGLPSESEGVDVPRGLRGNSKVAEVSRLAIVPRKRNATSFLKLFSGVYGISQQLGIKDLFFSVVDDDVSMYQKFGGIDILRESFQYGDVPKPVSFLQWNLDSVKAKFVSRFNRNCEVRV